MKMILVALPILGLAGCVDMQQRQEARLAQMRATCESYGFAQDDPRFPECMMKLDQNDKQRRAALAGALIMSQPKPQPVQPYQVPVPQTTTTNCNALGGQVNCTSVTR